MKLSEFVEEYSGSPWDIEKFAQVCEAELDDDDEDAAQLKKAATKYIKALGAFEQALQDADLEMG